MKRFIITTAVQKMHVGYAYLIKAEDADKAYEKLKESGFLAQEEEFTGSRVIDLDKEVQCFSMFRVQ